MKSTITLVGYKLCTTTVVVESGLFGDAMDIALDLAEAGQVQWVTADEVTDIRVSDAFTRDV